MVLPLPRKRNSLRKQHGHRIQNIFLKYSECIIAPSLFCNSANVWNSQGNLCKSKRYILHGSHIFISLCYRVILELLYHFLSGLSLRLCYSFSSFSAQYSCILKSVSMSYISHCTNRDRQTYTDRQTDGRTGLLHML